MGNISKKYVLYSVKLNSNRAIEPVDLVGSVTDIEIYEHLDMPFLTAKMVFIDSLRIMDRFDFQGGEYVTIAIKPDPESNPVEKTFTIESVLNTTKTNETTEVVTLSLFEDILFKSNFKNVNKAYSGNPIDMMNEISQEFLNVNVKAAGDPVFQKSMKVIIPNMDPLKAMSWLKNKTTTGDGAPGYLFSTYGIKDLLYVDLYTLLTKTPINIRKPFFYGASSYSQEDEETSPMYVPIHSYTYENTENMFKLISDGYVGAEYQFYDALTGRNPMKHNFNFEKDVVDVLPETDGMTFAFPIDMMIDEIKLQEAKSQRITQITSAGVYNEGVHKYKSYDEEEDAAAHSKKIIGKALKAHMLKAPITIRVPGQGFLVPNINMTIGNVIRILFSVNRPASGSEPKIDIKKSGDYVIYAAKHVFSANRYDIHLTCGKIKNFKSDSWPT